LKILKAIGAGIAITVCFFYLGCGSVQMANAAHGSNTAPLTIATRLLPSAIVDTPYVIVLDATGGTPGYYWSITSGQLPPGMSLAASTGIISGTPSAGGNYSVGVTLSDASTPAEKRSSTVTISVADSPLAIVTSDLPSATDSASYSQPLQATGGGGGYTWSISSGSLPAGLTLVRATGTITGTPKRIGTATFVATVRDGEYPAQSQSKVITLAVVPAQLSIASLALPAEVNGKLYSQKLQAQGGEPGYTWSIASGSLPQGLSLNASNGVISGMPAGGQSAAFTAAVSDSSNPAQRATASFSITVPAPPLAISAITLPSVTIGGSYSQALNVSGGTAPYTWMVTSGSLPGGIRLSATGAITGTAAVSGSSTFTATVVDSSAPSLSASISKTIVVQPTPLKVTAPTIPMARVGAGVSQSFGVTGGTATYDWQITSGSLPAGLKLTTGGTITGVATQSGTSTFTATATDSSSPAQSASATAAIVVMPTPLLITSSSLTAIGLGASYSQAIQVSGGSAPYTWSVTKGSLPAGLTLTPSSGIISGVATTPGTSAFTVTVADSSSPVQVTSAGATLVVAPAMLSIIPSSLAPFTKGTIYGQNLQAIGGTAPYSWTVGSGQLPSGLSLSSSGIISGIPTSTSTSSFAVTVTDSGSPMQTQSATLTIAATTAPPAVTPPPVVTAPTPLSIVSSALNSATSGSSYSQSLQASGGTPAYNWSIASGSLPTGLTLAGTTGTISGVPTTTGTFSFTASVTDNGSPTQAQLVTTSITVTAAVPVVAGQSTWFVRPDGGTRYSTNVPLGQCDGLADVAYPGSGTNQHCAYNDFRYLWDDDSGMVGSGAWVIAGGDTVVIRGCHALAGQTNAANPDCRIGWDGPWGGSSDNWCYGVGSYTCYNPPIPAGTATNHTKILGACAYGTYTCTPIDNNYPYASTNETQLFGGFSLTWTFNLASTQYVDIEGIELTTHNGKCTSAGSPSYPRGCQNNQPLDDYANNGFITNNATSNLLLQDVYVHGFNASGFYGPIGGPITMTRVFAGFNAFAGWNFADGSDTPDAAGSQILATTVTMLGNGCYEEYPISHAFPAQACYDDVSNGFGDAWSGQDTDLDTFVCNHCLMAYNTKDAFIGPHTNVHTLTVTNSQSYGNMGAQWKWNNTPNSTTTFENNLTVGNCLRFSAAIPGAKQTFALGSGLPGAYLSDYCRAAGNTVAINSQQNSYVLFANNTFVDYLDTVVLMSCGPSSNNQNGMCGNTPFVFTNNIFLSYYLSGNIPPGLFYINDSSITVTSTNNIEYGNRTNIYGATCGTGGNICSDPMLVNEPGQQGWADQTFLDNFNFHLTTGSPAIGAGVAYTAVPTTDYYGVARTSPLTIGAVAP
jgi:hypothetical protein